jgi:hypothetical protein
MAPDNEPMTSEPMTRKERLAAKLRENLRRRKVQARAQAGNDGHEQSQDDPLSNLTPKS